MLSLDREPIFDPISKIEFQTKRQEPCQITKKRCSLEAYEERIEASSDPEEVLTIEDDQQQADHCDSCYFYKLGLI